MKRALACSLVFVGGFLFALVLMGHALTAKGGSGGAVATMNGDVNGDGSLDISDALYLLFHLFVDGPAPVAIADSPELLARVEALEGKAMQVESLQDQANALTQMISVLEGKVADLAAHQSLSCPDDQNRFFRKGDGTIEDTCTGLMWQDNPLDINNNGQLDDHDFLSWQEAVDYCQNLVFAGFDDWRLPSAEEIQSIVRSGKADWVPSFSPGSWPSEPILAGGSFWSSNEAEFDNQQAWLMDFGSNLFSTLSKQWRGWVRAVRGPTLSQARP
jgi:uncharacterized protein DUF1566